MIVQNVVRVCLVAILVVLLVGVHRPLLVREWKRLRKRWRAKRRKPSRDKKAKPFAGLTRQPICEWCVTEAEKQDRETKKEPPAKIDHERGRRPEVDTRNHFCPEGGCRYYDWLDRGNIISNGYPSGGQWRQLKCVACGKYFQETIGTVFYGSSVPTQDIMRAIVTLCEGVNPRKVARIFEVDKDTVFGWLVEAALHSEAVIGYVMHNLHLSQVQMDELYSLLNGMRGEDEGRSCCWVWVATDHRSVGCLMTPKWTTQREPNSMTGMLPQHDVWLHDDQRIFPRTQLARQQHEQHTVAPGESRALDLVFELDELLVRESIFQY